MIGTIRKHNALLWWILVPIVVISMVVYLLPNARNGNQGDNSSGPNLGTINGDPITVAQLKAAQQEARIFMRLNSSSWPDGRQSDAQVRNYAEGRLVLAATLDQYHIVVPTDAAKRYIRQMLGVKPEDNVSGDKIIETLNKLCQEGGVTLDDMDRFARHQAGQEYLVALLGMSGKLITPKEAEVFYRRENEPIQTELVTFPVTDYVDKIKPTDKELEDFYTKHAADYRVPDRLIVNYIQYDNTNYTAAVGKTMTNLDQRIDQQYTQAGGANAYKDESGKPMPEKEAKAKLKKEVMQYYTRIEAHKDASAFLTEFTEAHPEQHPYTVGDLEKAASAKGLKVKVSQPFDLKNPPAELNLPARSFRNLFVLRANDPDDPQNGGLYLSTPMDGEDAVYVIGLRERTPSRVQSYTEVKSQVLADYKAAQAADMAKAAGQRFEQEIGNGIAQGKTFDTMCAAQFVRPKTLTPFSLTSTSIPEVKEKTQFDQLQDMAGRMQPGQFSPFMPTTDGGYVLYVKARTPANDADVQRELPAYVTKMRERLQIAAYNQWFNHQFGTVYRPSPEELRERQQQQAQASSTGS